MCRFSGSGDNGYRKIVNALSKSIGDYTRNEVYMQALRDLPAPETHLRFEQVEPALEGTFEWFFADESLGFQSWLRSDSSLYWIGGKPASGKSTLMKMALLDSRTIHALEERGTKCSIASFFFHDRGAYVQKSFDGLLRAILTNILHKIPELRGSIYKELKHEFIQSKPQSFRWTTQLLTKALDSILQQTTLAIPICLFLDALDEYAGDRGQIVRFLRNLADGNRHSPQVRLKICFSSRLEQIFVDNFSELPGLRIHEHTEGDIDRLVYAAFVANARMRRCLEDGRDEEKDSAQKLRSKILFLAEGVFIWVRLILDELLQEFTDGKSLEQLHTTLNTVPTDLHLFYGYIVTRHINSKYVEESRIMFELLTCALSPLTLRDFLWAFHLASEYCNETLPENIPLKSVDEMYRLVGSRSGSLIEIRHSDGALWQPTQFSVPDMALTSYNVQFLHQSVKTFASSAFSINSDSGSKRNSNGFVHLLKLGIFSCRNSGSSCFCPTSHLLRYACLAEAGLQTSQEKLFRSNWCPEIASEIGKETTNHEIPEILDILGFATLAELPRTLGYLLKSASCHDSQRCLQIFCRYFLYRGPMSEETSTMVLRELLKYNSHRRALGFIKDLVCSQHNDRHRHNYFSLICSDVYRSRDSNIRGYFYGISILLQELFKNGVKSSTYIPTRYRVSANSSRYRPSWTRIFHVEISHWCTKELVEVVLSSEDIEINALDGEGHTPLDYALFAYCYSVRTVLKTRPGDDRSDLNFDQFTNNEWYIERFTIVTRLINREAKVSGLYDNPHHLTPRDLDRLRLGGLPTDRRILTPPKLTTGDEVDAIYDDLGEDTWRLNTITRMGETLLWYWNLNWWSITQIVLTILIIIVSWLLLS